jgi:hypothetical protein
MISLFVKFSPNRYWIDSDVKISRKNNKHPKKRMRKIKKDKRGKLNYRPLIAIMEKSEKGISTETTQIQFCIYFIIFFSITLFCIAILTILPNIRKTLFSITSLKTIKKKNIIQMKIN